MAADTDPSGIPPESENLRQTGARKLEARPGEPAGLPNGFGETDADLRKGSTHLFEPVNANQEETRSAEGQNPPGSFGTEADPRANATEGDPALALPEQKRRPD